MPDSKFDLGDYVEVKDRLRILYELYAQARVTTDYILTREPDDKPKVIARALVYRTPGDPIPATGTSWMYLPGSTSYTKLSEIENAETSAVGRAIGLMGILIDRSIATTNEIESKAGPSERNQRAGAADHDPIEPTTNGGLIGTAEKTDKRTGDYAVRISPGGDSDIPAGPFIGFRLKGEGRTGYLVEAIGDLAQALAIIEADVIGQRVQVWGEWVTHNLSNGGKYRALRLARIQTPNGSLPPGPVEADSVPMFDSDTEAELDAAATAA